MIGKQNSRQASPSGGVFFVSGENFSERMYCFIAGRQ